MVVIIIISLTPCLTCLLTFDTNLDMMTMTGLIMGIMQEPSHGSLTRTDSQSSREEGEGEGEGEGRAHPPQLFLGPRASLLLPQSLKPPPQST